MDYSKTQLWPSHQHAYQHNRVQLCGMLANGSRRDSVEVVLVVKCMMHNLLGVKQDLRVNN